MNATGAGIDRHGWGSIASRVAARSFPHQARLSYLTQLCTHCDISVDTLWSCDSLPSGDATYSWSANLSPASRRRDAPNHAKCYAQAVAVCVARLSQNFERLRDP